MSMNHIHVLIRCMISSFVCYLCFISGNCKTEALKLLQNIDLSEKSRIL